jgi:hypothetical protein
VRAFVCVYVDGPDCTMNDCMAAMTLHAAIIQFSIIQLNCLTAAIKPTTNKHCKKSH